MLEEVGGRNPTSKQFLSSMLATLSSYVHINFRTKIHVQRPEIEKKTSCV